MNLTLDVEELGNLFEGNYCFLVPGMKFKSIRCVCFEHCPAELFAFPGQSAGGYFTRWSIALLLIFLTCNHASPFAATACDIAWVGMRMAHESRNLSENVFIDLSWFCFEQIHQRT